MKMMRFCGYALAAITGLVLVACNKPNEEEKKEETKDIVFTVAINSSGATEAEVIVRHTGTATDTWYGFLTEDVTTAQTELIAAQLGNVNAGTLHVGTSQTVPLKNLKDNQDYRYIAFGVNSAKEIYGKAGEVKFTTDADLSKAVFSVSAKEVTAHAATVSVSHEGYENNTWYAFVTTDLTTKASELLATEAAGVKEADLKTGKSKDVEFTELKADTQYRVIVGGVKPSGVLFGTLAEASFETPVDPAEIAFTATVGELTKSTASFAVSYNSQKELNWFYVVTTDLDGKAADIAAANKPGSDKWIAGPKTVTLENLEPETTYRFIVMGADASSVWGIPSDQTFTTLSDAYGECQFSAEVVKLEGTMATFSVTHTGSNTFEYAAFAVGDTSISLEDILAQLPADVDQHLYTGKGTEVTIKNLEPETAYRFIVVGRVGGASFGFAADVPFETTEVSYALDANWTVSYDGYQEGEQYPELISVKAATPGKSGKYIVVGTKKENIGTFTPEEAAEVMGAYYEEQLQKAIEAGTDISGWLLEDDATHGMSEFEYATDYYVYALGFTPDGIATGHFAYTSLNKPDTSKQLSYDDYLGTWKIDGYIWTISAKEAGKTYNIEGIPGSASIDCGNNVVVADYEAATGHLTITEQELGQYNDEEYGAVKEYFCGALTSGKESLWPRYPQQADAPAKVLTFVQNADGSYTLRPNAGVEAVLFAWVIQTGANKGAGNIYKPATLLPCKDVKPIELYKASYEDFLGDWVVGDEAWTLTQKVAGKSYYLSGAAVLDDFYSEDNSLPVVEFNAEQGQITLTEQSLGGTWDNSNYGACEDYVSGIFEYSGKVYPAYPLNTNTPAVIFTGVMEEKGKVQLNAGSCKYGTFIGLGGSWVILKGSNKGKGNIYGVWTDLPVMMVKPAEGSAAYNAWLGKWSIPSVEYLYDANDQYIGDQEGTSILTIRQKEADQSYLIKGIGPKNKSYEVEARFQADGTMTVTPQVVKEWVWTGDNEELDITEALVGLYTSDEGDMLTWSDATTLFTATLSGDTAQLVPGESTSGFTFSGFQFVQRYEGGTYGYGGEYALPNTLTRVDGGAGAPAFRVKSNWNNGPKALRPNNTQTDKVQRLRVKNTAVKASPKSAKRPF